MRVDARSGVLGAVSATSKRDKRYKSAGGHTVRTPAGGVRTFKPYTRGFAIKAFCTECLGFDGDPADCTATLCPLFPFRGRTRKTK